MLVLIALEIMSRYLRMLGKVFLLLHDKGTVWKNSGTLDVFQHFRKIRFLN